MSLLGVYLKKTKNNANLKRYTYAPPRSLPDYLQQLCQRGRKKWTEKLCTVSKQEA